MKYIDLKNRLENYDVKNNAVFLLVKNSLLDYFENFEEVKNSDFLDYVEQYQQNGTFDLMDHNNYKNFFENNYSDIFDIIAYSQKKGSDFLKIKIKNQWLDFENITDSAIKIMLEMIYQEVFFKQLYPKIDFIF